MKQCNFVCMGKGGVGKSFVAWVLAQYGIHMRRDGYFADTDPTNATFAGYGGLNVQHINILNSEMKIDESKFDGLMDQLLQREGYSVVDTGSPSFLPMMNYVVESGVFDVMKEAGHQVVIHTPLVGGPAMQETVLGLKSIFESTNTDVVVWENDYFGPVEQDGQRFSDSKIYAKYRSRILGVVRIRQRSADTFGKDIRSLLSQRLIFNDMDTADFYIMQKQRLTMIRRELFEQLEAIGL